MELEEFIKGYEEQADQFSEHIVSDLSEIYNNHLGEMTSEQAKELYLVYDLGQIRGIDYVFGWEK